MDDGCRSVHTVHNAGDGPTMSARNAEGPRPGGGDEGLRDLDDGGFRYRQRMDMMRPATIAPNPIAKFHADSDTMNGMRSPAT